MLSLKLNAVFPTSELFFAGQGAVSHGHLSASAGIAEWCRRAEFGHALALHGPEPDIERQCGRQGRAVLLSVLGGQ